LQIGNDVKTGRARTKKLIGLKLGDLEMDVKLQLIQELIPLDLMHVGGLYKEEVRVFTGDGTREMEGLAMSRWCSQWGSVHIGEQRLPIHCQRAKDMKQYEVVKPDFSGRLREPPGEGECG
jgi:hypothetical protein